MTPSPGISAIIPAYNSAPFIAQAIASIRAQSHPVDEIIVVDDGSTDDTAGVVRALGTDIHYLYQPNAGPSAARNQGVSAARGELIAFLDADDQWTPTRIAQQLAVFRQHPEVALVAGDMAEIDPRGNVLVPSVLEQHGIRQTFARLDGSPLPRALATLLEINFIPTGSVLVKRAALQATGGFDTTIHYGEDLEVWAKIAARHALVCLPEVLMLRMRHGANVTRNTTPLLQDLVKVMTAARSWGGVQLREQGADPDRLVARAWADLGYRYFSSGELHAARQAFFASLREKPTLRALFYGAFSIIPQRVVTLLRSTKQKLAGTGQ